MKIKMALIGAALIFSSIYCFANEKPFGNHADYGGNVGPSGLGFVSVSKKTAFQSPSGSASGYHVRLKWQYPENQFFEDWDVLCKSSGSVPLMVSSKEKEGATIYLDEQPAMGLWAVFHYDLWFTVCKNNPDRY